MKKTEKRLLLLIPITILVAVIFMIIFIGLLEVMPDNFVDIATWIFYGSFSVFVTILCILAAISWSKIK